MGGSVIALLAILRRAWPALAGAGVVALLSLAGVTLYRRGVVAGELAERGRLQAAFIAGEQAYAERLNVAVSRSRVLQVALDAAEAKHRARLDEVARRGRERAQQLEAALAKPAPDADDVADLRRQVEELERGITARRMEVR